MYAILSHGGRQYRVSAGDRLLVDRLAAQVGSVLALEPVLLTGGDGSTVLGKEVDGVRVAVTVLGHPRGRKLRIFKYKAKKRSRTMAGYRSDLTELRVESILARGAAVPTAAAAPAGRPARRRAPAAAATAGEAVERAPAAKPATAARAKPATAARAKPAATARAKPAATAAKPATPAKRAAAKRAPAKRAPAKRKETGDGA